MGLYQLEITSPDGFARLATLEGDDFAALEYVLTENAPHALVLTVATGLLPDSVFREDVRIYVYRTPDGVVNANPTLEGSTFFLIQHWSRGRDVTVIEADGAMSLLKRRIVGYRDNLPQSRKKFEADRVMIAIVRENLGTDVSGAFLSYRSLPDSKLRVPAIPAASQAPTVIALCAWRPVLDTLQDIAIESAQAGYYLSFDIVAEGQAGATFQVWHKHRGGDRRAGRQNTLLLSEEMGNLAVSEYIVSHRDTHTHVFGLGAGEGEQQIVSHHTDTAAAAAAFWGRREIAWDSNGDTEPISLSGNAQAELWRGRPRQSIAGDLIETDTCRYGIDFSLGTLVSVAHGDLSFDARLSKITVSIDSSGVEKVGVQVSAETVI